MPESPENVAFIYSSHSPQSAGQLGLADGDELILTDGETLGLALMLTDGDADGDAEIDTEGEAEIDDPASASYPNNSIGCGSSNITS